jgi:heme/copper-type cytochrome/quinol oxidase subunit 2
MVILILITYILIGVCIAIGYCVFEYKDYKNSNSKNWDTYYEERDLKEWSVATILFWPALVISMIPYLLAQIPRIVIKKYYKIND